MKSGEGISKGVGACQEALQRLLDGKPFMPEHVGLVNRPWFRRHLQAS